MLPGGGRTICYEPMLPGLDLTYTDPAQHLITAGQDIDSLDRDLSVLSDLSDV